jgi:hypothetical protein
LQRYLFELGSLLYAVVSDFAAHLVGVTRRVATERNLHLHDRSSSSDGDLSLRKQIKCEGRLVKETSVDHFLTDKYK